MLEDATEPQGGDSADFILLLRLSEWACSLSPALQIAKGPMEYQPKRHEIILFIVVFAHSFLPFVVYLFQSSSTTAHPTCMMCQNYEKQLQRLQRDCLDLKDKKDSLIAFAKKEKVTKRKLP